LQNLIGEIRSDIGRLLRGGLSGLGAGKEQARAQHQNGGRYGPRQAQQWIRDAGAYGYGLQGIFPRCSSDIMQQLLTPGSKIT
jgi:hypothetical protein